MTRWLFLFAAVLFCAGPLAAQSNIFLVRHSEKAPNDAKDPDLSDAGRARAETLAKNLRDAHITAIYATEFKRTQQTAEPLARALHINVTIVPAKETEALVAKLKATEGNALVVGHSNTLPEVIKTLGISEQITIADQDYDNLFVVAIGAPSKLLHLHYD